MSKMGNELIYALKDSKKNGLVTLSLSPDVATLRKSLGLTQKQFAEIYHINPETIKKWEQHTRKRMRSAEHILMYCKKSSDNKKIG